MSKKGELTKKQKEELQRLIDEITSLSTEVVIDYRDTPSDISSSIIQVHEDSPFLDEWISGSKWKSVIKLNKFQENDSK